MRSKTGFTLIELLVVITIILILLALLFPAISTVQENGNKARCLSNLKQLAYAGQMSIAESGNVLPYRGDSATKWGNACSQLLPYLKYVKEVLDCPSNPGITRNGDTIVTNFPNTYTDYEINGYICTYGDNRSRKVSYLTDYSLVAYAYDYPYDYTSNGGRDRAHKNGINVGYLDGHGAWLADENMGNLADHSTCADKSKFFGLGHQVIQLEYNCP